MLLSSRIPNARNIINIGIYVSGANPGFNPNTILFFLSILIVVTTIGTLLLLYKNLVGKYIKEIRRIGYTADDDVITPTRTLYNDLIKSPTLDLQPTKTENELRSPRLHKLKENSSEWVKTLDIRLIGKKPSCVSKMGNKSTSLEKCNVY